MASLIYNSLTEDIANGNVNLGSDTFKMLLVTSSYTPDKDTHNRLDDITNEVASGSGYTTGGVTVATTVTLDTANDKTTVTFAAGSWTESTITAAGAVIYKSRGGASSADELVFYNDFGGDISSTGNTFNVASSTITIQN
jgi:hypothetical protein